MDEDGVVAVGSTPVTFPDNLKTADPGGSTEGNNARRKDASRSSKARPQARPQRSSTRIALTASLVTAYAATKPETESLAAPLDGEPASSRVGVTQKDMQIVVGTSIERRDKTQRKPRSDGNRRSSKAKSRNPPSDTSAAASTTSNTGIDNLDPRGLRVPNEQYSTNQGVGHVGASRSQRAPNPHNSLQGKGTNEKKRNASYGSMPSLSQPEINVSKCQNTPCPASVPLNKRQKTCKRKNMSAFHRRNESKTTGQPVSMCTFDPALLHDEENHPSRNSVVVAPGVQAQQRIAMQLGEGSLKKPLDSEQRHERAVQTGRVDDLDRRRKAKALARMARGQVQPEIETREPKLTEHQLRRVSSMSASSTTTAPAFIDLSGKSGEEDIVIESTMRHPVTPSPEQVPIQGRDTSTVAAAPDPRVSNVAVNTRDEPHMPLVTNSAERYEAEDTGVRLGSDCFPPSGIPEQVLPPYVFDATRVPTADTRNDESEHYAVDSSHQYAADTDSSIDAQVGEDMARLVNPPPLAGFEEDPGAFDQNLDLLLAMNPEEDCGPWSRGIDLAIGQEKDSAYLVQGIDNPTDGYGRFEPSRQTLSGLDTDRSYGEGRIEDRFHFSAELDHHQNGLEHKCEETRRNDGIDIVATLTRTPVNNEYEHGVAHDPVETQHGIPSIPATAGFAANIETRVLGCDMPGASNTFSVARGSLSTGYAVRAVSSETSGHIDAPSSSVSDMQARAISAMESGGVGELNDVVGSPHVWMRTPMSNPYSAGPVASTDHASGGRGDGEVGPSYSQAYCYGNSESPSRYAHSTNVHELGGASSSVVVTASAKMSAPPNGVASVPGLGAAGVAYNSSDRGPVRRRRNTSRQRGLIGSKTTPQQQGFEEASALVASTGRSSNAPCPKASNRGNSVDIEEHDVVVLESKTALVSHVMSRCEMPESEKVTDRVQGGLGVEAPTRGKVGRPRDAAECTRAHDHGECPSPVGRNRAVPQMVAETKPAVFPAAPTETVDSKPTLPSPATPVESACETRVGRPPKKGGRAKKGAKPPKTQAQIDLEVFIESLTPEPPGHTVPANPTPSIYRDHNIPGKSDVTAIARQVSTSKIACPNPELEVASRVMAARAGAAASNALWDTDRFTMLPSFKNQSVHDESASSADEDAMQSSKGLETDVTSQCLKDAQYKILETLKAGRVCNQKTLIPPQEYAGKGGYFENLKQPFRVEVHPNVHFVADAHAYMVESAEVIGVLAGQFDSVRNVLYIQAAVPCLEHGRKGSDRGHTDVEVDPISFSEVALGVESMGLRTVGWYHSHPRFAGNPSPIDVGNQQMYQLQYERQGLPWVGMVVGREQSPSTFTYFRNELSSMEREDGSRVECPMLLQTHLASGAFSSAAAQALTLTGMFDTDLAAEETGGSTDNRIAGYVHPSASPGGRHVADMNVDAGEMRVCKRGEDVAHRMCERNALLESVRILDHNRRTQMANLQLAAGVLPSGSSARHTPNIINPTPPGRRNSSNSQRAEKPSRSDATTVAGAEPALAIDSEKLLPTASPAAILPSEETLSKLYESIAATARDPPLVFSEEARKVLNGTQRPTGTSVRGGADGEPIGDVECVTRERTVGGYGPEVKLVIDALVTLSRYYSRIKGRANMTSKANGMAKLEKLIRSLAPTLYHMELHPCEVTGFLEDIGLFLVSCFRETNPQLATKSTSRKRSFAAKTSTGAAQGTRRSVRHRAC